MPLSPQDLNLDFYNFRKLLRKIQKTGKKERNYVLLCSHQSGKHAKLLKAAKRDGSYYLSHH